LMIIDNKDTRLKHQSNVIKVYKFTDYDSVSHKKLGSEYEQ
jgi:hypothetical protein